MAVAVHHRDDSGSMMSDRKGRKQEREGQDLTLVFNTCIYLLQHHNICSGHRLQSKKEQIAAPPSYAKYPLGRKRRGELVVGGRWKERGE